MTEEPVTGKELSDLLKHVLDDLERITSIAGGVAVTLDDVRCRLDGRDTRP